MDGRLQCSIVGDALQPLFNIQPDAVTLTILLRAARDAERTDGSIRGLLGHMKMYNPFRSAVTPSSTLSKVELEAQVRLHLRNDDGGHDAKPGTIDPARMSSLWSGTPAGPNALEIFRWVVLGNFPYLSEVNAPAKAVWSDNANDASPLHDVARGLGLVSQRAGSPSVYPRE